MIDKNIEPLGDRIIIKAPEAGDVKSKKGNVIIIETATRGESTWGEVLLVGPGIYTQTGDLIPTSVNVGDLVLYKKDMVGDKITIDEKEYIMFREHDLMMVDRKSPKFDPKQLLQETQFKSEF